MTAVEEEVELDFSSGVANAEEFKAREDAARKAARGNMSYLSLKNDKDSVLLRFLFEANMLGMNPAEVISETNPHNPLTGWLLTKDHYAKTKAAPRDKPDGSTWPESFSAVCRRSPVGADNHPAYTNCYICDNILNERGKPEIPSVNMWASAVLREQVVGTQELVDEGRIAPEQIGQKLILDQGDWVDEIDTSGTTTGRKVWHRRYVIVNMSLANFFSPLNALADFHGTILDRDYKITRKGEPRARKVEYHAVAADPYPVTVMRDGVATQIMYDLREPEIAALYSDSKLTRDDLRKIVARRISKKHYDRYFDISVEVNWKDGFDDDDAAGSKPPSQQAAAQGPAAPPPPPTPEQQAGQVLTQEPTEGIAKDAIDRMRDKVMGANPVAAPAAEAETPAAAPAAPPAPPAAPPAMVGTPAPQQTS
jgi:hypothetical protein